VRTLGKVALLIVLWLLAWGEISLANLLSGAVVASALLLAFPPAQRATGQLRLRPGGAARLLTYVLGQLVISNVLMTRQILRRHPDAQPGVIAHRLRQPSEEAVTVMTSIIALSPGTMTVDVDPDSTTIYVHFFRLRDPSAAREQLNRLERFVAGAITTASLAPPAGIAEESA
jgi:multicomponent Na+:H+ antiporter subunit E